MRNLSLLIAASILTACSAIEVSYPPNVVVQEVHIGGTVLAFAPDAEGVLASGGRGGDVDLMRADGTRIAHWEAHDLPVTGLAFTPDGQRLVSAGEDGTIAVWDRGGHFISRSPAYPRIQAMQPVWSRDLILTGHEDGTVRSLRFPSLVQEKVWPRHAGDLHALAWHASGHVASAGDDGGVRVWSLDGEEVRTLPQPPTDASTLEFSPDGRWLHGSGWFQLYRWDLAAGTIEVLPTPHNGTIVGLEYTRTGTLASISRNTDASVHFLDPATGASRQRFWSHDLCGAAIAVSPDGRFLATTSDDQSVRIWWLDDLKPAGTRHPLVVEAPR